MRAFFESWPVPFPDRAAAVAFLGDSAIAHAWSADLERRDDGWWPRFDSDVMIETIAAVDERPRWEEWAALAVPTLVVFGRDGMFDAAARSALVSSRGGRVERADLAEGTHDAHLDAFEDWVRVLSAFLATVDAERGGVTGSVTRRS